MKLLISAYACAPGLGSDHAVGWNWATEAHRLGHEIWAFVSPAHRQSIEVVCRSNPDLAGIHWIFPEVPLWPLIQGIEPKWERTYNLLWQRKAIGHARELQRNYPKAKLDEDRIFINDGPIWTSAGMTAGVDLGLALIENDLGPELAKAVARKLVVYHRRGGGQSQFSTLLELSPKSDRIQAALAYARDNLHRRLTVPDLAEAAHLSPRQFSRAFHAETGQSPAKAIENLRVEGARNLMEQSRHPIDLVAHQTGFSDRDHMRRAFLRAFGQPPQVLRRNARLKSIDIHEEADYRAVSA